MVDLGKIIVNSLVAPERKRLITEIEAAESHLARLQGVCAYRLKEAAEFLKKARDLSRSGDIDSGWKYLHQADRSLLFVLEEHELCLRMQTLAVESDQKASGWRKDAVAKLVTQFRATDTKCKSYIAAEAYRIFQEGADNTYFKMRTLRRQMVLLSLCMLILLGAFVMLIACRGKLSISGDITVPEIVAGGLLGGIGACLSALASFASAAQPDQRIPQALANVSITLLRPLIGIASGLVAVLAIKAGFVKSEALGTAIGIIPLAFGFSERLVVGTISRIR